LAPNAIENSAFFIKLCELNCFAVANRNKYSESELRDIGIWLDDYKDIFSDFDPRPYAERALSDDFISELKKVCDESEFKVKILNLLMPEKIMERKTEEIISRLKEHHIKGHYQAV